MKPFNKDKALRNIKINKNKNTYIKRLSISLSCLFLILVVMLFTFAKFESNSPDYTLIQGKVEPSTGDINIVSYIYDGTSNSEPPQKSQGYILTDLTCTNATGEWDDVKWELKVSNLSNKVKCNLTFDNQSNYQIIEFNPNGGYLAEQYIKGTIGEQIGTLPTPIKTGYTFTGWYTASDGGTQVTSSTTVNSSLNTLYARYSENTKSVSYSTNGTSTVDVENYKSINITRNFSSSLSKTTLWTNPDPSVSFAAQRVTLSDNWNNYKYLEIEFKAHVSHATYSQYIYTETIKKEELENSLQRVNSNLTSSNNVPGARLRVLYHVASSNAYYREFGRIIDEYNALYFYGGVTSSGNSNNVSIPLSITGVN